MLMELLPVFALLSAAWALHDGQAARDRQNRNKHLND
jgi:hypothetical protein